jgi:hypothetical protein
LFKEEARNGKSKMCTWLVSFAASAIWRLAKKNAIVSTLVATQKILANFPAWLLGLQALFTWTRFNKQFRAGIFAQRSSPRAGLPDLCWRDVPNHHKIDPIAKLPLNSPYRNKIYQMAIEYTRIFQYEALQNVPKLVFLACKYMASQNFSCRCHCQPAANKFAVPTPLDGQQQ